MRNDLDHLPERKRRDLEQAVRILFAEFEDALVLGTHNWKRQGRILKIILYGSHARGDWVEDRQGGYFSDYDILVIVNHEKLTDIVEFWAKADDHLVRAVTIEKSISAPVNFIVHDLHDVNRQLQAGRPFFVDIATDGIALYEQEEGRELATPKSLLPEAAQKEGRRYFDEWFGSAEGFLDTGKYALSQARLKESAFQLHQAAERFYHCVLLVLTLYSPKSHKLRFLRSQAESNDLRLIEVWPRDTKFGQRCFELLRRAYVDARYSPHYKITEPELEWIVERIEVLQRLVREICEERLAG